VRVISPAAALPLPKEAWQKSTATTSAGTLEKVNATTGELIDIHVSP